MHKKTNLSSFVLEIEQEFPIGIASFACEQNNTLMVLFCCLHEKLQITDDDKKKLYHMCVVNGQFIVGHTHLDHHSLSFSPVIIIIRAIKTNFPSKHILCVCVDPDYLAPINTKYGQFIQSKCSWWNKALIISQGKRRGMHTFHSQ